MIGGGILMLVLIVLVVLVLVKRTNIPSAVVLLLALVFVLWLVGAFR